MKKGPSAIPTTTNPTTSMTSKSKSTKSIPRGEENEAYVVIPPDGGWGWVVAIAAFYTYAVTDGIMLSFGVFLDVIAEVMDCSTSQVSLIGAVQTCFYCLIGPFSAALVNRFGYRKVSIYGCILSAASCAAASLSRELYHVAIIYGALGGIGFGMTYVSAVIAVGFYFERWRGLASGLSLCGAGIGTTLLPPLLDLMLRTFDWKQSFMIMSLIVLSCVACGVALRPIKPIRVRVEAEGAARRTLSYIKEVQETKSKMSQFFLQYNNAMYPTLADVKSSVVALMRPPKLPMTKSASSEIMATTLASDASDHISVRRGEGTSGVCARCCGRFWRMCFTCKCASGFGDNDDDESGQRRTVDMPSRPLYRDDIFYAASVATLPEYKKSQISKGTITKTKSTLEYHISVTRTITHVDIEEQMKCKLCPEAVKRTLATMLDIRLLKSPSFIMISCNAVFIAYAFFTPFLCVKDRAVKNGFPEELAVYLVSTIGLANTIGRILSGVVSIVPAIKPHVLCSFSIFVAGIGTVISGLCYDVWAQFLYAAVFGFCLSPISTLKTVIIVDSLGLEKLTNAVGMILLFQGLATLAGTSISGLLNDSTGDYHYSFYIAGSSICLASLFLIPIKIVSDWEKKASTNQ